MLTWQFNLRHCLDSHFLVEVQTSFTKHLFLFITVPCYLNLVMLVNYYLSLALKEVIVMELPLSKHVNR